MENVIGIITSVSASYYGILLTVVFALFGSWSYLTFSFWENKKLTSQKKLWVLAIIILILNVTGLASGLKLFSILQDISYECFNKCDDVSLKLSAQRCALTIQVISMALSSVLIGIFGFLVKREKVK